MAPGVLAMGGLYISQERLLQLLHQTILSGSGLHSLLMPTKEIDEGTLPPPFIIPHYEPKRIRGSVIGMLSYFQAQRATYHTKDSVKQHLGFRDNHSTRAQNEIIDR